MFRLASRSLQKKSVTFARLPVHHGIAKRTLTGAPPSQQSYHGQSYEEPWTVRRICGALFCAGGIVLTAGLCAWQIRRLTWKQGMIDERRDQMRQVCVVIDSDFITCECMFLMFSCLLYRFLAR
jgi:hypothetical protein